MSYDFNIDRQCLPTIGKLTTLDGKHEVTYTINFGYSYQVPNYVYNDNNRGNGIAFGHDSKSASKDALELLGHIPESEATPGTRGDHMKGHYVLLTLRIFPRLSTTVILFISDNGGTYQHYRSNVMKTEKEVLAEFAALVDESERPARERKAAAAKREEMFTSGAM